MENRRYKIALFMLPLLTQGGGAEKYFIELAQNLKERGIEADIITMDEKFFRKFARLLHIFSRGNFLGKVNITGREDEISIAHQLGKARWIKTNFINLGKHLRSYDVIYSKNEIVDLFLLKMKGYKKLPPIIVGVHTPIYYPETKSIISKIHNFLYASFLYKWLLSGTKLIHASNRFTKEVLKKKFGIGSELIYYPFSATMTEKVSKENLSGIEFDPERKNIVYVGRLGEQKGTDILMKIITWLSNEKSLTDKVCLNIFGSGDKLYEAEIKKIKNRHSFVRYFGHIENKYIPDILSRQNFMIAPFRWEILPFSILEAQAMGLPVIAFDIPGPNDIVEDDQTGFLAKSEFDFFNKIRITIEEDISFNKEAIIQKIKNKFDPEKISSEMIKMLSSQII
jgi:glycosyltransferase involved in cell wall biosynthesis